MKTKEQQTHDSPPRWRRRLGCAAAVACLSFTSLGLATPAQAQDKNLGMLSRLPADTELYIGFHGMSDRVKDMMNSNMGKTILGQIKKAQGGLPWEDNEDAQMGIQMADSVFGKEIFIAFGKGTSKQSSNLIGLLGLFQEAQLEEMSRTFQGLGLDQAGGHPMKAFFKKNADSILAILEKAEIPPMLIGFKMGDMKDTILDQIDAMEGQLPEFIDISEVPVRGLGRFNSWSLQAKTLLGPDQREAIIDAIGLRHGKRVFEILGEKKIEVCHGMVDGYMLISVGTSHDHLALVKDPAQSLLATPELQQLKEHFGKKVFNVTYASQGLQASFDTGDPLAQVWKIAEAFGTKANMLKDSTVLREGLASLIEQGKALFDYKYSSFAGLMMWDEGLRFEAVGGAELPALNLTKQLEFLPLIDDTTFISMNGGSDPAFNKATFKYLETIFNTALGTVDELVENEDTAQLKEGLAMAKKEFMGHGKEVYGALKSLALDGLGSEQAVLIDLKGSMPKIPATPLPTVFFKKGRIPRIAIVNKVKDRKVVGEAWDKMIPPLTALLEKFPTENGQGIPFPDFLSTEKNGLTTYFYPFPFTSNNCLPSVSISDELFFLSTSKDFSEMIAAKAKANATAAAAGNEKGRGGWQFWMNFEPMHGLAKDWLKLVEDNLDEIAGGNDDRVAEFRQQSPRIKSVMEVLKSFRSLKAGAYKDGEFLHTSMHLKMVDFPSVMELK